MGTIKASAKILFRNQKKDIWKQKKFLHKAPSKKIVFEWNSQLSKAS